jgi:predicted RNA-binding Zn ribbon-like protein
MTGHSSPDLPPPPPARWRFGLGEVADGTPVCLALANTRERRRSALPVEHLHDYADLLRFGEARALCAAGDVARLARAARDRPRLARAEFAATLALRESIHHVFAARARGDDPAADSLAAIDATFGDTLLRLGLAPAGAGVVGAPWPATLGLEVIRLHVALSAASLLTSALGAKVRECRDERGCGRLFVDRTRNGARRYCMADGCGNRARQAAWRARRRLHAAQGAR